MNGMEEMEESVLADVMPDLRINGKDAFAEWGVHMGEVFLDTLFAPPKLKDFIENQSRQIDGKVVLHGIPKLDARDLTLAFTIEGTDEADYWKKYMAFVEVLKAGLVVVDIPGFPSSGGGAAHSFKLTYKSSQSYAMNAGRTFAKLSVKFNEANPADTGAVSGSGEAVSPAPES